MTFINDLKHTARGVEKRVANVAQAVPVQAVTGFVQDTFEGGVHQARNVGKAVQHVPETVDTWKRLAGAVVSGDRTLLPGHMPAYPTLDATQLDAAKAAGAGKRVEQPFLQDDKDGNGANEPVTLYLTGSKADVVKALVKQGWVQNNGRSIKNYARQFLAVLTHYDKVSNGPVSSMFLYGRSEDMAFSKNVDYNLGRDHMRLYKKGVDPKTGQDVWAVAATRDVAASVTLHKPEHTGPMPWDWKVATPGFGHQTDEHIDRERDLIMHDLLASGQVKDFQAVNGVPKGAPSQKQPDGSYVTNGYPTDGKVYQVAVGA
ncbi:MAG: hypothetical protein JWM80_6331 [Cyanobacteria bacterium RYN_339]|nr:hypothetical protein [Cyanobacteria bacterium RYN_339]